MVVLTDTDPSSPTKSQQGWPSQAGTSVAGSEAPQSPFGGPSSQAQFVPPPPAYEPDPRAPLLPGPGPQKPPRRSRTVAKRFCSAFSIAIVIFIALSILKEIIFGSISWSPEPIYWDNVPKPKDGNVVYCTSEWPEGGISVSEQVADATAFPGIPVFSTSKSFSLPINSSLHYLITRGGISSGLVTLRGDENADPTAIGVKVVARYHTRHALSRARICELKKTEGGVGVGVYTPSSRIEIGEREEDKIYFIITVTIPTSHKSVLNLNGFETTTNNFRHTVENLGNRVHFDHISLLGTNGAIQTDQVFLSQGKFVTTNGKITGKFSATDSLVLRTTNGLIDTEVDITNDDTHKASDLLLETTNGRLTSKISLLTTHDQRPQPKGGHFTVKATTTNGRLDISYPNTPVNSLLNFDGVTTNGPAEVSLHAAYEGTFRVASSGSTELDNENVVDPSGRKRIRNLRTSRYSSRLIEGVVHWGPEQDRNAEMGSASIKTTNGEATLRLI